MTIMFLTVRLMQIVECGVHISLQKVVDQLINGDGFMRSLGNRDPETGLTVVLLIRISW